MTAPKLLDLRAVADRLGIAYVTVRNYHYMASQRRASKTTRAGDMPAPDQQVGASPAWLPSTIDGWQARRPGQGAGGGRRKSKRQVVGARAASSPQ